MIRTALVGFGLAGEHLHAPYLKAPDYQLVAVQSSRPEAVAAYDATLPVIRRLKRYLLMNRLIWSSSRRRMICITHLHDSLCSRTVMYLSKNRSLSRLKKPQR
ncbi:hypothetical protein ACRPK8_09265 [Exiguobacterium sp. TDN 0502]|uniref:hypothetical protein n=1 Tax=Exiguobacterium sp. TDN 0502 TaxID=3420731 RepID=UPI003D785725